MDLNEPQWHKGSKNCSALAQAQARLEAAAVPDGPGPEMRATIFGGRMPLTFSRAQRQRIPQDIAGQIERAHAAGAACDACARLRPSRQPRLAGAGWMSKDEQPRAAGEWQVCST